MALKTRAQKLLDLIEDVPDDADANLPTSAIRSLRGSRKQVDIATKAKISQAHLSHLEAGQKSLTDEVAARLAPALGVTADQLTLAEQVGTLKRAAMKGGVDPTRLLEAIMELSWSLPDSEVSDQLVEALLAVLKKAMTKYDKTPPDDRVGPGDIVAVKGQKPTTTRDSLGRRIDKPYRRWDGG